jgi:hypothetical protein
MPLFDWCARGTAPMPGCAGSSVRRCLRLPVRCAGGPERSGSGSRPGPRSTRSTGAPATGGEPPVPARPPRPSVRIPPGCHLGGGRRSRRRRGGPPRGWPGLCRSRRSRVPRRRSTSATWWWRWPGCRPGVSCSRSGCRDLQRAFIGCMPARRRRRSWRGMSTAEGQGRRGAQAAAFVGTQCQRRRSIGRLPVQAPKAG